MRALPYIVSYAGHEILYPSMALDPIFSLQTKFSRDEVKLKEINFMTVKVIENNKIEPPNNSLSS